jgi:hypothetical protein
MAEIQFERRGLPLWKVLAGLLAAGAAAFGGYELLDDDAPARPPAATAPATPPAGGDRPQPPAGATPSPRPTTARSP